MCALGTSWFVCQSKPREEVRARYFLADKGFEVYLPMMEAQRIVGCRASWCHKPLFPSYLFVRFDEVDNLATVRWTKGIHKILPASTHPVAVDEEMISSIRSLAHRDGIIRKRPLRKNDRVRILQGPFKELIGIFEEWASDSGRVRILLEFVNYQARIELHHTLLDKVA